VTTTLLRKLASCLVTLFVVVTASFFLIRLAPGGPFDEERAVDPEVLALLEAKYDRDKPLIVQYARYIGDVVRGDLGLSMKYADRSVNELLAESVPASATVGLCALTLGILLGVPAGVAAALRRNRLADHAVMALAVLGISLPSFVLAMLAILVFSFVVQWLPASWPPDGRAGIQHVILPAAVLAAPLVATIARLTRASMLEILHQDYVRTARAKGLPPRRVVFKHALRNAALPVVSYLGPATAAILTGSLVVEEIFGIPGIGRHFVKAAFNRDQTFVMGTVILYASLLIVLNFVVDILYAILDPRVRLE